MQLTLQSPRRLPRLRARVTTKVSAVADIRPKPARFTPVKPSRIPGFNDQNRSTPRLIRRPAAFARPDTKQTPIHPQKSYAKIQPIPDPSDDNTKWGKTGFGRTGMTGES